METSRRWARDVDHASGSSLWAPLVGVAAAGTHLAWEALHGGIRSHHLLAREDLPAMSNLWGLLILPALGLLTMYFVRRRSAVARRAASTAITAFIASLLLGCALSAAFSYGLDDLAAGLLLAAFLAGSIVRTYRVEYIFGFVVGMTYVFGPVIPTIAATIAATISCVAHFLLRPALVAFYRTLRPANR